MIIIGIVTFFCIQIVILIFTLALCRAAASNDRQIERAHLIEQAHNLNTVVWVDSQRIKNISPDTNPTARLKYSSSDS